MVEGVSIINETNAKESGRDPRQNGAITARDFKATNASTWIFLLLLLLFLLLLVGTSASNARMYDCRGMIYKRFIHWHSVRVL